MTDKQSQAIAQQLDVLEKGFADLERQINSILADVAKRCPDAVVDVSGIKGDER